MALFFALRQRQFQGEHGAAALARVVPQVAAHGPGLLLGPALVPVRALLAQTPAVGPMVARERAAGVARDVDPDPDERDQERGGDQVQGAAIGEAVRGTGVSGH